MQNCRMSRFIIGAAVALAVVICTSSTASAAVKLPGNTSIEKIDFERHIMGLFGRMGCNAGSCHGSFQGKGGFRLSLFGYQPEMDYFNLTRELAGRRLNAADPAKSLLLLKATGQVPHGGAVRFAPDSWQYQVFYDWIAQGAKWTPGSGDIKKAVITPPEHVFDDESKPVQLKVTVHFGDGSKQDITPFCEFRTNDDGVAEVTHDGVVSSVQAGATTIIVKYRGEVLPVRVFVPQQLPDNFAYPKVPANNYIDQHVFKRLKKLNMPPSDLSSDTEFLRRVYIDTVGRLPSPDEIRAFLKDKSSNKRAKVIDRLLEDPMHAALWATRFCDITGNDTLALELPNNLRSKRSQMWHAWFKKRFHENMPYDEIVKGVLTATSRNGQSPEKWAKEEAEMLKKIAKSHDYSEYAKKPMLDMFWRQRRNVPIEQWGEKTAAAFMGVRVECAQCHKHPFDRWTQEEYRAYANIFAQVAFGTSPEARKVITSYNKKLQGKGKNRNNSVQLRELYLNEKPRNILRHPETNAPLNPRPLGGPEMKLKKGQDAREVLFEYLVRKDNPYFARAFVNRLWGHYFGIGIVDPVDDFSLANPPSNPELLDALAKDFIEHDFDIRRIEKAILNSRVYQLSVKTNATNKLDKNNYSHAYVRPMMAEVVLDVINSALGTEDNYGKDIKPGSRAIELGPSIIQGNAGNTLKLWGRPPRQTACDCERGQEPGLPNKLYLMTDTALLGKIRSNQGRLSELLKNKQMNDEKLLEELFLATVSRFPTETERKRFNEYIQQRNDRREAFTDALWALMNTKEFILNH